MGSPDRILRWIVVGFLVAFAASVVAYLGLGLDARALLGYTPGCLFRWASGVDCPGCGMTRSFVELSHLDLAAALRWNPAGPFLLFGMGLYAFAPRSRASRGLRSAAPLLLAGVLVVWLVRL